MALNIAVRAAQQQTGAAAAAVALMQDKSLVCRARVGDIAPDIGVPLDTSVGITGASVRSGDVLYCADAETNPRVDGSLCRRLDIRSILVVPIRESQVVTGLVEVLSHQPDAFNRKHVGWLMQLSESIRALTRIVELSPFQATAPGLAEPVLPGTGEEAEPEPSKNTSFGVVNRLSEREKAELSVVREVLQHCVGNLEEIGQQLMARLEENH